MIKSTFVLMALLMGNFAFAGANGSCVDISGDYSSPYDSGDRTTTFSIKQDRCENISVLSIIIIGAAPLVSNSYYHLNGSPVVNCSKDYFNDCGSLKVTADGIEKTNLKNTVAGDDEHGFCQFTTTVLTKDEQGNLVETVRSANCEDNYVGPLTKPVVYLKKK